jgi:Domain of unknown function (DUF4397)
MTRWGGARIFWPFALALLIPIATPIPALASDGEALLTILHGLPQFTADVYVNGELTLDGFDPVTLTEPLRIPAGTYDVAIRNVGDEATATPVLEASLALSAGRNYTAVAHLNGTGEPELSLFRNLLSPVPAGKTRLVVRNVADSPVMRVELDGEQHVAGLGPMSEGDAVLPAGRYSISMAADDGTSIGPMPIQLVEGTAQVVYAIGSANEGTLDLMVQSITGLASAPAEVQTGTGDAAAPSGWPGWATAVMALAAAISTLVLVDALRRPARAGRIR